MIKEDRLKKTKTLSREEFKKILDSGRKVTNAHLYEPDRCTDGSEFVLVQLSPTYTSYKRLWPTK